jgi:hypothetical protein
MSRKVNEVEYVIETAAQQLNGHEGEKAAFL